MDLISRIPRQLWIAGRQRDPSDGAWFPVENPATGEVVTAYFYTRDFDRVQRVSAALRVGMVDVNRGVISDVAAPFGGVGESGVGREGGAEGINEYLEHKLISFPMSAGAFPVIDGVDRTVDGDRVVAGQEGDHLGDVHRVHQPAR